MRCIVLLVAVSSLVACKKPERPPENKSPVVVQPNVAPSHEVKMRVLGMTCPESCVAKVRDMLAKEPGVIHVAISYEDKLATLGVDDRYDLDGWEKHVAGRLDAVGYKSWSTRGETRIKGR